MNPLFAAQWQALLAQRPDLAAAAPALAEAFDGLYARRHGQFDAWLAAVEALALPAPLPAQLDQAVVSADCPQADAAAVLHCAQALMPWRKGPFRLAGLDLDCEWRSDIKYQRLLDAGLDLRGQKVLDVGTGNGYFLYRYLGSGAALALGLDPSWHYFAQFLFLQRFMRQPRAVFLPMSLNEAPLAGFDCSLSMGVLYHRRDPLAFLAQLRDTLKPGGCLVLETLVVDGGSATVYLPEGRYAGMHNVWFLPSSAALARWLRRLGFAIEHLGEAVATTAAEQRRSAFMQGYSLSEFLAEAAACGSTEPPPQRAVVIARKA